MYKDLQTIGLGKNEAQVYEALVKFGPCRAGVIINKLDIHRNLVYQSLETLIAKGFAVKVIKKNVWTFQITDPKSLLTSLKSKEMIAHEVIKQIQTFHHQASQQIVVYEGIDSYRNYWMSSLEKIPEGSTIHCLGTVNNESFFKLLGPFAKKYMELKIKKNIIWQTIHFKITKSEIEMLKNFPELTRYRLWPKDIECAGNFNVTNNTIIIQSFVEPLRIIEIKDSIMVSVFQNYFDMMWEKSTPITPENIEKFKGK
ncbi:MAG TPA: helix-turn-helix domain-containing protein [Candidatus Moranbacteria bacterium]|nr:helix-turn-helix domain-containing protein [Candidatus Moranbacteria bacterium]